MTPAGRSASRAAGGPDRPWFFLVTAEHGGHGVPAPYGPLFKGHGALLRSHRGWDPGTLALARHLAGELGAACVEATTTRLLVDLNRSAHHPRVFSEVTRPLARGDRDELLARYHTPHRDRVRDIAETAAGKGRRVLHLGIHSFTPELDGRVRRPELALLYDPARPSERWLAGRWAAALRGAEPTRAIGRNDPYRGNADGLTTWLRTRIEDDGYLGIEVEVNQRLLLAGGGFPRWVGRTLLETLEVALGS